MPQIELAQLNKGSFIDSESRYNSSDLIYWGDKRLITFKSYKRTKYIPGPDDKFYIISKGTEYRPDLVSFRSYSTVSLWWKIMEVNGMKDIMEFAAGTTIIIPNSFN